MEARQVIRPNHPNVPALPTYDDPNRLIVPLPHWAIDQKKILAAGSYASKKLEIVVPVNLVRRTLFAGIVNSSPGSTDFGGCIGEVVFYLANSPALRLPFEFHPHLNDSLNPRWTPFPEAASIVEPIPEPPLLP